MIVPPRSITVVRTPRLMANPPGSSIQGATRQVLTATRQKVTEIRTRPTIFCRGVRPSERLCATLSMSSSRPSEPVAKVAAMARTRSVVHLAWMTQVTSTASRKTTPPMVGVPCLTRWRCGPSARICWPTPSCFMSLMKNGMSTSTMNAAMATLRNTV